jgi:hypothetical protein
MKAEQRKDREQRAEKGQLEWIDIPISLIITQKIK